MNLAQHKKQEAWIKSLEIEQENKREAARTQEFEGLKTRLANTLEAVGFSGRYSIGPNRREETDPVHFSCRFVMDDKNAQCIALFQPHAKEVKTKHRRIFQFPGMIVTAYGNISFKKDDPNMDTLFLFAVKRFATNYGR